MNRNDEWDIWAWVKVLGLASAIVTFYAFMLSWPA